MADDKKPVDNTDALAAMAGGANLDEPKEGETAAPLNAGDIDTILADGQGQPQPPAAAAVDLDAPAGSDFQPSRVNRAAMMRRADSAVAAQYKKMMVPLLLIIGVLLTLIGVASFLFSGEGASVQLLGPEGRYFALIATPLGLILLVGSWLLKASTKK